MRKIFLGRPVFWLLWVVIIPCFWVLGKYRVHVIHFNLFISLTLILVTACVLFIVFSYREGEDITREPFKEDNPPPTAPLD